ncbi:hypothetical protein [Streptomyces lydicus]|uniref:hypothetical protein n=1 Tax=Streptomyces lydicus TaxID=47763 RepID=UPI00101156E9|nr:hypothetical protein [Streptomyces lydicus]MCZ1006815.1 hypothetical protein [Streptomyces lydicus]
MALLEKHPNNAAINAQLHKHGVNPATVEGLPVIDPSVIEPRLWPVTEEAYLQHGVIGRHKVMRYDFGAPVGIGSAVHNTTASPITRVIGGSKTVEASTTVSVSATVSASFFNTVTASVSSGFSQTWSSSTTFKDELTVPIPPGHMMWLEVKPVMRILEGDFVFFVRYRQPFNSNWDAPRALRFSGTVTAPGLEGTLKDVITVREAVIPGQFIEESHSVEASSRVENALIRSDDDGVVTMPSFVAAALLGDAAKSEDVTDQVRPA